MIGELRAGVRLGEAPGDSPPAKPPADEVALALRLAHPENLAPPEVLRSELRSFDKSAQLSPERVIARGPVKSRGPQAINREIDAFRAAIDRSGSKVEEAFIAVLAPGWLDHFIFNEYYNTDEEFLFAPG